MAGTSLLTLIDDIASLLDDIALLTKVAGKKTMGVVGDDLALNANQVAGIATERELPVVWAVAKGSLLNKAILVPAALGISAVTPWLVTPLLMCGGAFLCFEGVEKLVHKFLHRDDEHAAQDEHIKAAANPAIDLVAFERQKIKGAVRTDFVLSAEIMVIALGTVQDAPFVTRVLVLCAIALGMTIGVYGLVAGIVKIDDAALYLSRTKQSAVRLLGRFLLRLAPVLMKTLGVAGTVAMFLVGGGIFVHNITVVHHVVESWSHATGALTGLTESLLTAASGVLIGAVLVALWLLGKRVFTKQAT
jgi:predicted DNA repair protein MutK